MNKREYIARRAIQFFQDGDLVNLGIGLPTAVIDYLPADLDIWIESENGVIGIDSRTNGEVDPSLVDADGKAAALRPGGCCFDSFLGFGLVRGGHVDITVLGAFEVDQEGNLANWTIPGKLTVGMGGAMDLVCGAKKVLVVTEHCDKYGNPKILKKCRLPLTATGEVDYIITELCVLHKTEDGLILEELAPHVTIQDVLAHTEAELVIPATVKTAHIS